MPKSDTLKVAEMSCHRRYQMRNDFAILMREHSRRAAGK